MPVQSDAFVCLYQHFLVNLLRDEVFQLLLKNPRTTSSKCARNQAHSAKCGEMGRGPSAPFSPCATSSLFECSCLCSLWSFHGLLNFNLTFWLSLLSFPFWIFRLCSTAYPCIDLFHIKGYSSLECLYESSFWVRTSCVLFLPKCVGATTWPNAVL